MRKNDNEQMQKRCGMTGWNLPPGVEVSDIPGNSREDVENEARQERIENNVLSRMNELKRILKSNNLAVSHTALDAAEIAALDYDEEARLLFIYFALDIDEDYFTADIHAAAKRFVEQVKDALRKSEESSID